MRLFDKLSVFFNKGNKEIEVISEKKLFSINNMISQDRKRYIEMYPNNNKVSIYINSHFDNIEKELKIIVEEKDLHKLEFFSGQFIMKDEELFTYLNNLK